MDFDKNTQEFIVTVADAKELGLPEDITHYPLSALGDLSNALALAQERVNMIDVSEFPFGSARSAGENAMRRHQEVVDDIRNVLHPHIEAILESKQ